MMYNVYNKMITIIMVNVKSFLKRHFCGDFNKQFLKINLLLLKKAVLHTTTPMHCKARQVLRDLFSINQRNSSEMIFVVEATRVNLKILKT